MLLYLREAYFSVHVLFMFIPLRATENIRDLRLTCASMFGGLFVPLCLELGPQ